MLGDVQGEHDAFFDALAEAGADRVNGNPDDGCHIIQVGDLLHLGADIAEYDFMLEAENIIDEQLIGNHEFQALGGPLTNSYFDCDKKAANLLPVRVRMGKWKAATSVGDWLITHAGLHPFFQEELIEQNDGEPLNASEFAHAINERFANYRATKKNSYLYDGLFDAIDSMRGGYGNQGGIFWAHITYLVALYSANDADTFVKQIVGHSPVTFPKQVHEDIWDVDCGRGVGMLVSEDNGETWVPSFHKG